jgi:RNA polymerase II subunit A-like phosphatase
VPESKVEDNSEKPENDAGELDNTTSAPTSAEKLTEGEAPEPAPTKVSVLEELVSVAGWDDPAVRQIQAEEQITALEHQVKERPLLHMQEKLDEEDKIEEAKEAAAAAERGEAPPSNGEASETHHRHRLLNDDDQQLVYLQRQLLQLHGNFYEEFDRDVLSSRGDRVAHLRPGHHKKVHGDQVSLELVPDMADVLPRLRYAPSLRS